MGAILAIDQGTSGTKSIIVGEDDTILATVEQPIRPRYLPNGGVEQNPQELLDSVWSTARRAVEQAGVPLEAVTLTNQGESVLAWDRATGRPLSDIVVWQDSRAQGICDERRDRADMIAARTGLVLDPYFTAPKMSWVRRNVTTEGVITTTDTWILWQLTHEFVTDPSTASRSLLKDLSQTAWDPELLSLFDLDGEAMPRIVPNDGIIGTTQAFGGSLPVAGAVVDQQGALLAESCIRPGDAKCTFGTGAFLLAHAGTASKPSAAGLSESTAWVVDGEQSYCYDGQVYTAASAVRWLQGLGFIDEAADMDGMASEDTGGVVFVPALAGLAAPWWRSDVGGAFVNMTLSTSPADLVGAVLQGIAANTTVLAGLVADDLGNAISTLRVDGGLTRSRFLMQSVADLAQTEVETYASPHATPLGAVALARKALNPGRALAECIPAWHPSEVFTPQWSTDRADSFMEPWRATVNRLLAG